MTKYTAREENGHVHEFNTVNALQGFLAASGVRNISLNTLHNVGRFFGTTFNSRIGKLVVKRTL